DLVAVRGLAHHLDRGVLGEDADQAAAEDRVVVGDHDPDHGATPASVGSSASTVVPSPGRKVTVQVPPSSSARSRIVTSPLPEPFGGVPDPSSATVSRTVPRPGPADDVSAIVHVVAPAWRTTLVTASVAMR